MTEEKQKPAETLRDGKVKATIWRNVVEKDGQTTVFFAGEPSVTYEDKKTGDLKDGHSLRTIQWLQLADLARDTYKRMRELEQAEKAANKKTA